MVSSAEIKCPIGYVATRQSSALDMTNIPLILNVVELSSLATSSALTVLAEVVLPVEACCAEQIVQIKLYSAYELGVP